MRTFLLILILTLWNSFGVATFEDSINVITGEWHEENIDLILPGPFGAKLTRTYAPQERIFQPLIHWHFNLPDLLGKDKPSRKKVPQEFNCQVVISHDDQERIQEAHFLTPGGQIDTHQLFFSYSDHSFSVTSNFGEQVTYFIKEIGGFYALEKVEKNGIFDSAYAYIQHPFERKLLMISKTLANYDRIEIDYYLDDTPSSHAHFGKIRKLSYFKKGHIEPGFSYSFSYSPYLTEVLHSSGTKKVYTFNPLHEIEKIQEYDEQNCLFKTESCYWNEGHMVAKVISGTSINDIGYLYKYDTKGKLIQESIIGNLSGASFTPIVINQGRLASSTESYSKYLEYSDQGDLILEKEENGKITTFLYNDQRLLKTKLVTSNGERVCRSFFYYNADRLLNVEIHDDGNALDEEDLSGATFRIKKTHSDFNLLGLPQETSFYQWSSDQLQYELTQSTYRSYTHEGELLEEKTIDRDGSILSHLIWTYSPQIKHLQKCEKGKSIYQNFSVTGLLLSELQDGEETLYQYNNDRQLIKKEKKFSNGPSAISHYIYNIKGLLEESIDCYGARTRYFYDAFDRQSQTQLPPLNKENLSYWTHTNYDALGRVIKTIDPQGYAVHKILNARGQPIEILYPDGTKESFSYHLDGKLHIEVKRDGQQVSYQYDSLGNMIRKECLSNQGVSLEVVEYCYHGTRLIEETSSLYGAKTYRYDALQHTTYQEELQFGHYIEKTNDSKGQLIKEREGWIHSPENSRELSYHKSSITLSNNQGELLLELPNRSTEENSTSTFFTYNDHGDPILARKHIDREGNILIQHLDADEKPIVEIRQNPFGEEYYRKQIQYDIAGNKVLETFFFDSKSLTTKWSYGPLNRLEKVVEGYGTVEQKSHSYEYNEYGQLASITKPDGIKLFYQYNDRGAIAHLSSSDQSISYTFEYDSFNNVVYSNDLVSHIPIERTYNQLNQLTGETFQQLSLRNSYDSIGRRTCLTLPDQSSIHYKYDSFFLRQVLRKATNQEVLYSSDYLEYDLSGNPKVMQMAGNLGLMTRSDAPKTISSPFHNIALNGQKMTFTYPCFEEERSFLLDSFQRVQSESGLFYENYGYDHFGNRGHAKCNSLNQVIEDQEGLYSYDANGNLVSWRSQKGLFNFSYDALNRLIKVEHEGKETRYIYDCFHRRIARIADQKTIFFIYDGLHEIGTATEEGHLLELKVIGHSSDHQVHTVAIELDNCSYAPLEDLQGSIIGLIDIKTKEIAELYVFSAFGKEKILMGTTAKNPWRYAGKRKDSESELIYFGRRYYHPISGRWSTPDPAGYVDGPNLYCYAKNNPIFNQDAFGLFSFKSFFKVLCHPFDFLDKVIGKLFNYLCGYTGVPVNSGVYGQGEVNDHVRITFINGMLTNTHWLMMAVTALSKSHGGVNVHYVHRPNAPFFFDALRAFMVKIGYITPHARALAETWQELIHEMKGEDKTILHFSHSIGSCETMAALGLLSKDLQGKIKVYSFGSPCLGSHSNWNIQHFVSVRDGICLLDLGRMISAAKGKHAPVTFVGSFCGIPFIDHFFSSKSYLDVWSAMGKTFVEWYGSLL
ncbi:MAG: RHS repeat-associated core domain-containing protein [Parachlamydiaceae bacterium]